MKTRIFFFALDKYFRGWWPTLFWDWLSDVTSGDYVAAMNEWASRQAPDEIEF
jgi:hypothetical protein